MHLHTQGFDRFVSDVWRIVGIPVLSFAVLSALLAGPIYERLSITPLKPQAEQQTANGSTAASELNEGQLTTEPGSNTTRQIVGEESKNSNLKFFIDLIKSIVENVSTIIEAFNSIFTAKELKSAAFSMTIYAFATLAGAVFLIDQTLRFLGRFFRVALTLTASRFYPTTCASLTDFVTCSVNIRLGKIGLKSDMQAGENDYILKQKMIANSGAESMSYQSALQSLEERSNLTLMLIDYCLAFIIIAIVIKLFVAIAIFVAVAAIALAGYYFVKIEIALHVLLATKARDVS